MGTIAFDYDGVIVDSLQAAYLVWKKTSEELNAPIKIRTLEQFRNPATSNFARDSMMTIVTQNYREYLRLSVEYQVPIRKVKSVTESYLGILDEWVKHEGNH